MLCCFNSLLVLYCFAVFVVLCCLTVLVCGVVCFRALVGVFDSAFVTCVCCGGLWFGFVVWWLAGFVVC